MAMKRRHCFLTRASFTVETAMLSPILIGSVIMLLYLTAHVHNRTCLHALAAEQAVSGHEQETPALFSMTNLTCGRSDTEKERSISYRAGSRYLNGEEWLLMEEEAVYRKYYPIRTLRNLMALKELGEW